MELGPFRIIRQLGAGGMGVVYLARDQKLDRDVALKVLPLAWAAVDMRLRRFHREAKILAGLTHPRHCHALWFRRAAWTPPMRDGVRAG